MPLLSQNHLWTKIMQINNAVFSEPISGANKRKTRLMGVNGIGGASRLNAMLWTRGSPGNYETWSAMGLTDWAWEKVEPYFKRLEDSARPFEEAQLETRGRGGPIELRKPAYPYKWIK